MPGLDQVRDPSRLKVARELDERAQLPEIPLCREEGVKYRKTPEAPRCSAFILQGKSLPSSNLSWARQRQARPSGTLLRWRIPWCNKQATLLVGRARKGGGGRLREQAPLRRTVDPCDWLTRMRNKAFCK